LVALLEREPGNVSQRLAVTLKRHRALFGAGALALLASASGGLAGKGVLSIYGSEATAGRLGMPNVWHFLYVLVQHVAGIDLAVGVVPFAGAIVAAVLFLRTSRRGAPVAFASVSISVTVWLLLEVAFHAALFD